MPSLTPLRAHSSSVAPPRVGVAGSASLDPSGVLRLHWHLSGALQALRIPASADSLRQDDLWRHTCVEAFVRAPSSTGYFEFNVSPSTAWNVYAFDGYRTGMRALDLARPPVIEITRSADSLEVRAEFAVGLIGPCDASLAAVVETDSGELSYWAVTHASERPDFHHADGFSLRVG